MKILFIHQNFPAQFIHLAPALAKRGHEVHALTISQRPIPLEVTPHSYAISRATSQLIHPWLKDTEAKVIRGEAVFNAATALKNKGFNPDVIVAHPGWGESLFIKEVWPHAKLGLYCEFFYVTDNGDVGFDPEFTTEIDDNTCRLKVKNINQTIQLLDAAKGLSPTQYQRSVFPEFFHHKIDVIHDGINTQLCRPNPQVTMTLNGKTLSRYDEIITFVNRNLEPMRGYHIFMRALPAILKERPHARVIIVGGDDVSYGKAAPEGKTWRSIFLDEVRAQLDMNRVHFVGKLAPKDFVQLLQLSHVHVYLTYPFVLSWSLLEAMSVGCAVVASDTPPVREVITHNQTGRLVDFFDAHTLSTQVIELLKQPSERVRLGEAARKYVIQHYDLDTICLPQQILWVEQLAQSQ